jgi:hypothetical protein
MMNRYERDEAPLSSEFAYCSMRLMEKQCLSPFLGDIYEVVGKRDQ